MVVTDSWEGDCLLARELIRVLSVEEGYARLSSF